MHKPMMNKPIAERYPPENLADSGLRRIIRGLNPNLTREDDGERRFDVGEPGQS
jgi:hypothetical protein